MDQNNFLFSYYYYLIFYIIFLFSYIYYFLLNDYENPTKKENRNKKATSQNPFLLYLTFVLFCLYYPQPSILKIECIFLITFGFIRIGRWNLNYISNQVRIYSDHMIFLGWIESIFQIRFKFIRIENLSKKYQSV